MPEIRATTLAALPEDGKLVVSAMGVEVGIFRLGDEIHAWRNACPHQGGPVCQGRMFSRVVDRFDADGRHLGRDYDHRRKHIVCPWHGAEFDIRTGRHAGTDTLRLTPVRWALRDGEIWIDVG